MVPDPRTLRERRRELGRKMAIEWQLIGENRSGPATRVAAHASAFCAARRFMVFAH
jgi:hypothetical protein